MHLRVWYKKIKEPAGFFKNATYEQKVVQGTIVGVSDDCSDWDDPAFVVRSDGGEFSFVQSSNITKSEWVEKP